VAIAQVRQSAALDQGANGVPNDIVTSTIPFGSGIAIVAVDGKVRLYHCSMGFAFVFTP
jgi:hypothetical protein